VIARITTLHEIETHWSIDDLADAHEALDIDQEAAAAVTKPKGRP